MCYVCAMAHDIPSFAISIGLSDVARLMVEAGGDATVLNKSKQSALSLASNALTVAAVGGSALDSEGASKSRGVSISGDSASASVTTREDVDQLRAAIDASKLTALSRAFDRVDPHDGSEINLNRLDDEGCSCLHLACVHGLPTLAEMLVDAGANVNVLSAQADTPLHYATYAGHANIVQLLLNNGADPTLRNHEGMTSIDVATDAGIKKALDARSTYKSDGDSSDSDEERSKKLQTALRLYQQQKQTKGKDRKSAKPVKRGPGRPPGSKKKGTTAKGAVPRRRGRPSKKREGASHAICNPAMVQNLHEAIKQGDMELVIEELSSGTPLNAPDVLGRTALHICAQYNQIDIAKIVLDAGADVDSIGPRKSTALHLAAEAGHIQIADLLLDFGASLFSVNDVGQTPHEVTKDSALMKLLQEHSSNRLPAQSARNRKGGANRGKTSSADTGAAYAKGWGELGHTRCGSVDIEGIEFAEFSPMLMSLDQDVTFIVQSGAETATILASQIEFQNIRAL